jgi:hypothetical protein
MEPLISYRRYEDMSALGTLSLIMEEDGDVILTASSCDGNFHTFQQATVQFCTAAGGGQSPRVREALINLAAAIAFENQERPQQRGNTRPVPQGQGEAGAATEGVRVWECDGFEQYKETPDGAFTRSVWSNGMGEVLVPGVWHDWRKYEGQRPRYATDANELHGSELSAALGDEGVGK